MEVGHHGPSEAMHNPSSHSMFLLKKLSHLSGDLNNDTTFNLLTHSLRDTFPIILSFTHCGNKVILRVLRIILVILPEHPSDTKDHLKMEMEMEIPSVKASANSDIIFFFTSTQDGTKLLDDERLSLADDLKKAHDQNQNKSK
ncbi:hypothetical protein Tco_1032411 [Tanacetum coccineum]|uniref:Uncharacterized protein n=1 Tax=Tanacetum coccineum TaxID=301880 RepID=A0ABQ5GD84_9ASTR